MSKTEDLKEKSWLDRIRRPTEHLNSTAVEWKNVMSDFLLDADIFPQRDLTALKSEGRVINPALVMDMRHEMIRQSSNPCSFPKENILTEARKLLREEKVARLTKDREARIVNKEIEQLKQNLRNSRLIQKIEMEADVKERKMQSISPPERLVKKYNKVWKRLESFETCAEIDSWVTAHATPRNLKEKPQSSAAMTITVSRREEEERQVSDEDNTRLASEGSSDVNSKTADSEVSFMTEIEVVKEELGKSKYWTRPENCGKGEIMERFFRSASDIDRIKFMYKNGTYHNNEKNRKEMMNRSCNLVCEMTCQDSEVLDKTEDWSRFESDDAKMKINKIKSVLDLWKQKYYWNVWKRFTRDKKFEKSKASREEKIEMFLKRLGESKNGETHAKSAHVVLKTKQEMKPRSKTAPVTLEKRFNKQRKFSGEAKKELVDRSEEEDEKLVAIEKETKRSSEKAHNVLDKGMKKFDPSLRGKVRVLKTISSTGKSKVEKVEVEMKKAFPLPEVLEKMEKREEERKKRWESIRKRKNDLQEEREKLQREKEEEMKLQEENEKKRKIEEQKEKRRLEKEAEEERRREREKMKLQLKLAQAHHNIALVKTYGLDPWKCLIRLRKLQQEKALRHAREKTLRSHLLEWREHVKAERWMKNHRAERFHSTLLKRTCLRGWIEACNETIKQYQVAVDWADLKLIENTFRNWLMFVQIEQLAYLKKKTLAENTFKKKLLGRTLENWKVFPHLMRLDRDKEDRKRVWRQKVQEVLPDYRALPVTEGTP